MFGRCLRIRPGHAFGHFALQHFVEFNLQVPAMEIWQPSLSRLSNAQQDRIRQIEFYEMLQREVAKRMPRPDS